MKEAEINGIQASAKGLRHSSIETTAIYLNVSGQEERRFAERMWKLDR